MPKFILLKTLAVILGGLFICPWSVLAENPNVGHARVSVFANQMIHFSSDSAHFFETDQVLSLDNGRVCQATVVLPEYDSPVTIMAHLKINPIPKDELSVHDKWDRAGQVRLAMDGSADVEIVKFITAYGGATEYAVDVSHLAPLLRGERTIRAFIDTWVSPAWEIDFALSYQEREKPVNSVWAEGVAFEESFNYEQMADTGVLKNVTIPEGLNRVMMYYFVSGHCTDGRDADEFISKDNVIYIDGRVAYRFRPWRDDCTQFRAINPYTKRWSDGYWSSDYSRSGWCPGDVVSPLALDLSDHLTAGDHTIRLVIENIRPKDANGQYGYWRVSSQLVGWDTLPVLEN